MLSTLARGSLRFPSAMLDGTPEWMGDDAAIQQYTVPRAAFVG
jgi:hypothetical protein